jgi:hypothetical protein
MDEATAALVGAFIGALVGGLLSILGGFLAHRYAQREEARLRMLRSLDGVRKTANPLKFNMRKDQADALYREATKLNEEGIIARGKSRKLTDDLWTTAARYQIETMDADPLPDGRPGDLESSKKALELIEELIDETFSLRHYLDRKFSGFFSYRRRQVRNAWLRWKAKRKTRRQSRK